MGDNNQNQPNAPLSEDISLTASLISIEKLILSHVANIEKVREETKKHTEMLDDILLNDPVYREHTEAAKEANRVKLATKQQILKHSDAATLNSKIMDLRTQMKELRAALSNYLQEYLKVSGTNQIENDDGEVSEIVYNAKLVKRSGSFRP